MLIEFTVLGDPKAQKRHQTFTKGKGGRPLPYAIQIDPSKGDKADFLALAHQHAPPEPLDCPIGIDISFYFGRPGYHYRTNGELNPKKAELWHTCTPDVDNLLKFILDALNSVFWSNDSRICWVTSRKFYDVKPRIEIKITTMDEANIVALEEQPNLFEIVR